MEFINQAVTVLQTLVVALGAGLAVWGVVNLMEGYGNDNPGAKSQGIKQNEVDRHSCLEKPLDGRWWCGTHRHDPYPAPVWPVLIRQPQHNRKVVKYWDLSLKKSRKP